MIFKYGLYSYYDEPIDEIKDWCIENIADVAFVSYEGTTYIEIELNNDIDVTLLRLMYADKFTVLAPPISPKYDYVIVDHSGEGTKITDRSSIMASFEEYEDREIVLSIVVLENI